MNILLLGSGGREHALAWKINQSHLCQKLFIAPGNAGTAQIGTNVPSLDPMYFGAVLQFVKSNHIDCVVIGPEAPLVEGIADYLKQYGGENLIVVGPTKVGAILEGSKDFSKRFMEANHIPTAAYRSFTSIQIKDALDYLDTIAPPYVLKADGLAAGKGVIICTGLEEAKKSLEEMLSGKFGKASNTVVIEEYLEGAEFSVFILTDANGHYVLLPEAKDYKRIGEGDTGPNTGGMGAVSPVPFVDNSMMQAVQKTIIEPTLKGLSGRGISYEGFIFFGLINHGGVPKVIEYNCRLGDPETEVILPRLEVDLLDLFVKMHQGKLYEAQVSFSPDVATTVMLVSKGYPGKYEKRKPMFIPSSDALYFHAGTTFIDGTNYTNGGRVLACTALGGTIEEALDASYEMVEQVQFEGKTYRLDIGQDLMGT